MTNPDDDDMSSKMMRLKLEVLERAKKGKSKIEEDEVERPFEFVPGKSRSTSNYESLSLNGASTSSSSLPQSPRRSEPSSSSLLVTELNNPQNPKPKRRALQANAKSKKTNGGHLSWKGKDTRESLLKIMRDMNVADQEPELIFEKTLFKTDVNPGQGRLSMPISQIIRNNFLTREEVQIIHQDIENEVKVGVRAFLVNQEGRMWRVSLKRCESKTSWNYSVTCGWNDFVAANGLKEGDGISVWTFGCRGYLCLAIIPREQ